MYHVAAPWTKLDMTRGTKSCFLVVRRRCALGRILGFRFCWRWFDMFFSMVFLGCFFSVRFLHDPVLHGFHDLGRLPLFGMHGTGVFDCLL